MRNRPGRRTGAPPVATDSLMWRICKALDEHPRTLARKIGVPYSVMKALADGVDLVDGQERIRIDIFLRDNLP